MVQDALFLAVGLAILTVAAEHFVTGAARLAQAWKLPLVIIGAVVIGFGTSAPELVVSVLAASRGELDISVGNVTGSNIANLTLVLGAAAVLTRVHIGSSVIRFEAPVSLAAVMAFAVAAQGGISRAEGALLAVALGAVLSLMIRRGLRGDPDAELTGEVEEFLSDDVRIGTEAIRTMIGLVLTLGASQLVVLGAEGIAVDLGWSTGVVGLTIVAIGTSLPELATTVIAARRNETDLIVGNLLGSNVFNSLAVGAAAGLIAPGPLRDARLGVVAAVVMTVVCAIATARMAMRSDLGRPSGAALLTLFVGALLVIT